MLEPLGQLLSSREVIEQLTLMGKLIRMVSAKLAV